MPDQPIYNVVTAVTPDDNLDVDTHQALLIGGAAGNLSVVQMNGAVSTFAVPLGVLPVRVKRVRSTLTTATGISLLRQV